MIDRFEQAFSSMAGDDSFPLASGSKGIKVRQLQQALILLGHSIPAGPTGNFGSQTQAALKSGGYPISVGSDVFARIIAKATAKASGIVDGSAGGVMVSENQLREVWKKSKSRFGGLSKEPDFDKWVKREMRLAKLKDIGKGLFTASQEWIKYKQSGSDAGDGPYEEEIMETDTIWGMPKAVVYVGGIALAVLAIWGTVTLVRRARVPVKAPAPIVAAAITT